MSLQTATPNSAHAEYSDMLDFLRQLGDAQATMAEKYERYRRTTPKLADRFQRASFAAMNARMMMHAAVMAEFTGYGEKPNDLP